MEPLDKRVFEIHCDINIRFKSPTRPPPLTDIKQPSTKPISLYFLVLSEAKRFLPFFESGEEGGNCNHF